MRDDAGRRLPLVRGDERDLVYGRRAVREALRGRREVLELLATERAVAAEPWLRERGSRACGRRPRPERAAGHARPPGRGRPVRAVPLRRRLRARRRPSGRCSPCSTGSPTRATSAPSAAAPRARAPPASSCPRTARRSSRRRSPRVGRGDRAPADRRRHEPRPLPRGGEGRRPLGLRRGRRGRDGDVGRRPHRRRRARLRRRGQGAAPARPPQLRRLVSIPLLGRVESLNVSVAAALLLYEARRQRHAGAMAEPTLYLFDGYNLLHAGPLRTAARLATCSRASSRRKGARGVLVFDGAGDDAELGPLSVRFAPDADTLLERLAAEHRRASGCCSSPPTRPCSAPPGVRSRTSPRRRSSRDLEPRRARAARAAGSRQARRRDARPARAPAARRVDSPSTPSSIARTRRSVRTAGPLQVDLSFLGPLARFTSTSG